MEIDSFIQRIASASYRNEGSEMGLKFYPLCPQCVEEQLPGNQPFSRIDESQIPMIEADLFKELEQFATTNDKNNNNNNNNNSNSNTNERRKRACGGTIRSHWLKKEEFLSGCK